jgi:hypothetical protein
MKSTNRWFAAATVLLIHGCGGPLDEPPIAESATSVSTSVPRPDHVVIAILENTGYSAIAGSASAPYINSLMAQGASFTSSHGVTHPSQPNYVALFSGDTRGVTDDSCPRSFTGVPNLGRQLLDAGLGYLAYSEDLPSVGYTGCSSGKYARKHAPWVNFDNVPAADHQPFTAFPTNFATLPTVSFVVPNLCNDMHDCSIATGDGWIKNHLDGYVQWAKTHNSLLILTWDEDDFTASNQIPTVFVGAMVQPGNYAENINHYNVLHTVEAMYGLAALGNAGAAISDIWTSGPTPSDFSLSVSPSALSIAQGGAGAATATTKVSSGSAQSVTLSVTGAPSGVSVSFAPSTLTAGGTATVSVDVGAATAEGTYTLSITATGSAATHTAPIALTVSSGGGGGGIVNGGFESGDLSGWSTTGAAAVTPSAHTGSFAVELGSSNPSVDSSAAQTFTVPADGTQLSFWYQITCPDTVKYDWANATLKDNSAGTTTTVLANSCSNDGVWRKASTAVTPGHSYTLTLANHDDDYAGDATFTRFDDVVISTAAPTPIVNPAFETGDLQGWTSSGSASVSSLAHTGGWAAQVGGTSATNGDSSIAQTFSAPAGVSALRFWYDVRCPDTVRYDWTTATLRDNTAGTTATILPKTCNNTNAWVQVSASVLAGHSYTLTLISHDDAAAGDPTYTAFDDLQLN